MGSTYSSPRLQPYREPIRNNWKRLQRTTACERLGFAATAIWRLRSSLEVRQSFQCPQTKGLGHRVELQLASESSVEVRPPDCASVRADGLQVPIRLIVRDHRAPGLSQPLVSGSIHIRAKSSRGSQPISERRLPSWQDVLARRKCRCRWRAPR